MGQIVDLIRGSFPKDVNIELYFTKSSSRSYGVSLFGAEDALVLRDGGWLKVGLFGGQFLLEFSNTYTLAVHVLGFTFNGIFSAGAEFRADAGKWGREAGRAVGLLPYHGPCCGACPLPASHSNRYHLPHRHTGPC
jgi:hypothetical protein